MAYTRHFFEPVEQLGHWFAEMQMAQASAERILSPDRGGSGDQGLAVECAGQRRTPMAADSADAPDGVRFDADAASPPMAVASTRIDTRSSCAVWASPTIRPKPVLATTSTSP